MKIRKFNEAVEPIDLEYIRQCFIDLIEEGIAEANLRQGRFNDESVSVKIKVKYHNKIADLEGINVDTIGGGTYFQRYAKSEVESARILSMAADSIARLADEYPEYRLSVTQTSTDLYMNITAGFSMRT